MWGHDRKRGVKVSDIYDLNNRKSGVSTNSSTIRGRRQEEQVGGGGDPESGFGQVGFM